MTAPAIAAAWPVAGEPVLVMAGPGAGPDAALIIVVGSGGRLLSLRADGRVAIAMSEAPGFSSRLYAAGAALVLRGRGAACGASTSAPS